MLFSCTEFLYYKCHHHTSVTPVSYILCFSSCFSPFTLFLTWVHFIFSIQPHPSCQFSSSLNLREKCWYVGCHTAFITNFYLLMSHKKESGVFKQHSIFKEYKRIIPIILSMQNIDFSPYYFFPYCFHIICTYGKDHKNENTSPKFSNCKVD